jgi:hypothetical protein
LDDINFLNNLVKSGQLADKSLNVYGDTDSEYMTWNKELGRLEIYADDVKCTHGATVGQLNKDGLFYLRSRGIDKEAARVLLIYAFASDLVSGIEHPGLKAGVEALLFEKLPGDCEPAAITIGAA